MTPIRLSLSLWFLCRSEADLAAFEPYHKATASEPRGGKRSARPVGAVRALPKRRFGKSCNT